MYRLIIVDDEDIVRAGLCKNINWAKYDFMVVKDLSNAADAVEAVQKFHPDMLLTDIQMPKHSGLDMIAALRKTHMNLPIVILSAYDQFSYAQEAISYGVCGYLLKPVEESQLDAVMEKVLNQLKRQESNSALSQTTPEQMSSGDIIERAKKYIHENYTRKISQEDVAAHCYITPAYLSSLFKARLSCNFVDYVTAVKIKEAKYLLENSSYQVKEIAYRTGYEDYTYFCKVFKKTVGVSPLEYRFKKIKLE